MTSAVQRKTRQNLLRLRFDFANGIERSCLCYEKWQVKCIYFIGYGTNRMHSFDIWCGGVPFSAFISVAVMSSLAHLHKV